MRYFGINEKKRFSIFSIFLLLIGVSGMIFTLISDFFKHSVPSFGINQLAGFVVSSVIALAGLRKILLLRAKIWNGLLLFVYLSGIFFMGLRSRAHGFNASRGMLRDLGFSFSDAAINILGFMPLGYLMLSYFLSDDSKQKKIPAVYLTVAICIGISLIIELSQYYVPGRSSSLLDILFNGLGAFIGIGYGLLEQRLSRNN